MELEWLEMKAEQLRSFVDSNPIPKLTDRIVALGEDKLVIAAKIEDQLTSIRNTLKDYALIIEVIAKLREKEAQKKLLTRGDADLSPFEQGEL